MPRAIRTFGVSSYRNDGTHNRVALKISSA
jgi:hypothetical protein